MNDNLLKNIETQIAEFLVGRLERANITLERASEIARFVLESLPEDLSDEEVEQIIPKLDDEFVELSGLIHNYMNFM